MPRAAKRRLEMPSKVKSSKKVRKIVLGNHGHRYSTKATIARMKALAFRRASEDRAYVWLLKEPYQTVYDVFCDTCTGLSAHLVKIKRALSERGQDEIAREYERERVDLYDQKDAVSEMDVPAQVRLIKQWTKRQYELGKVLDELCN